MQKEKENENCVLQQEMERVLFDLIVSLFYISIFFYLLIFLKKKKKYYCYSLTFRNLIIFRMCMFNDSK